MTDGQVVHWRSGLWTGLSNQILAIVVVLVLILAVTIGTITAQLRNHELTAAGNQLKSLAVVLADQAERAFEAIELIEVSIVEKLQNDGVSTPDEFRRWMEGRAVHEQLRNRIAGLPQVDALIAVDADGNVLNFSRFWPIPTVNVADRDYFKALKDQSGPISFVARPVQNRSNNSWNIYIARKFVAADGATLGLIVGAINLSYLERLYGAAAPQPDGSVALFRNDGVLLARHPHVEPRIGDSFSGRPIFQGIDDPDAQDKDHPPDERRGRHGPALRPPPASALPDHAHRFQLQLKHPASVAAGSRKPRRGSRPPWRPDRCGSPHIASDGARPTPPPSGASVRGRGGGGQAQRGKPTWALG